MTDAVRSSVTGSSSWSAGAQTPADDAPASTSTAGSSPRVDSSALLGELAKTASSATLGSGTSSVSSDKAAGAITNAAGAPAIDGITINFSPEDLAAALVVLQGKTQEAQIRTAKEGLEVSRVKQQQTHEKAMSKIDEWIKKSKDAAAKQKALGIFGWIAKIFTAVAAALATVVAAVATAATGGAAAPLLALAAVGLVGATLSLASGISQAAGGPPLEISTLMTKLCGTLLQALGVPEDKIDAASKIMAGGIALLVATPLVFVDAQLVGNMFGGITALATSDPTKAAIVGAVFTAVTTIATMLATMVITAGAAAPQAIAGTAKTLSSLAKTGSHVAGAVSGGFAAASGGLTIAKSINTHDAEVAQAEKKKFDALIVKLQQQMQEDREQIKEIVQQMQDAIAVASQMIAAAGDQRSQIAANVGRVMVA